MAIVPKASPELRCLLAQALAGQTCALTDFLTRHSKLPGSRMNTGLVAQFAGLVAEIVTRTAPPPPVELLEILLDGWANLSVEVAPVNQPAEILPCCAVLSYGYVAVARPEWWQDEVSKLYRAAADPRWRVREMVATALQQMLKADGQRSLQTLDGWLKASDPLVIRAVVAAIAEPPLLKTAALGEAALRLQQQGLAFYLTTALPARKATGFKVLRLTLGYSLSVVVAAAPAPGLTWLRELAGTSDPDLQWILSENWKKNRLKKYV